MKKKFLRKNYLFCLPIIIIFLYFIFQQTVNPTRNVNNAVSNNIMELNSGWMYKNGDSTFNSNGEPLCTLKYNRSDWKSFTAPGMPPHIKNNKDVWLKVKLPTGAWKDPCLLLKTNDQSIEVYLDNKLIHKYGDMHPNSKFNRPGAPLNFISLPENFQNKTIFFRLHSTIDTFTGWVVMAKVGSKSDLIMSIVSADFYKIIFASIFIFIGLICIFLFLLRKIDQSAFLSLGFLSIVLSFWVISQTDIKLFAYDNPKFWNYVIHFSNYLIPVGVLSYVEQVFSIGKIKSLLGKTWKFILSFAFLVLFIDLIGVALISSFINVYLILLICSSVFSITSVIQLALKGNSEAKIFLFGILFLAITGFNDFFSIYYRILPWSISLLHLGMLLFILSLLFILGLRFIDTYNKLQIYSNEIETKNTTLNQMWKEIKNSRDTLAGWNENLEETVRQKTAAIKNILDNAGQGFLTFSDDLIVDEEYSSECEEIFAKEIGGLKFSTLIFPEGEERNYFELMLVKILHEKSEYKKEIYLPLLPDEVMINDKYVKINYRTIEESQTNSETIFMVILTDITDKKFLENKMEEESKVLKMVVKATTNYNDFIKLIRDYEFFCNIKINDILDSDSPLQTKVFELFRAIHTFKGSCSQMDMVYIVHNLHDFETELSEINNNLGTMTLEEFKDFLSQYNICDWIKTDMNILYNILGEEYFMHEKAITVDQTKLIQIENKLSTLLGSEQLQKVLPQLRELRYKPFKELLKTYPQFVLKLSERLEKPINPIEFKGNDIFVDPERYHDFAISLVHIFRNIMDHGIEDIDERMASGKSEAGNITCNISSSNNSISLNISDDGKGIDINKIKKIAIEQNMFSSDTISKLSDNEIIQLIFRDGFTTKDRVSELSGRGVGLSAVMHEVEKLNGSLNIRTEIGIGTEFNFLIPL